MALLALSKNDVHLLGGYVSLPGIENARVRCDVPLTACVKVFFNNVRL
jgi:hypothetical protein